MSVKSFSIELAQDVFVFVTPRGSFAKSMWGDSWTRSVDNAHTTHKLEGANKVAREINTRLGRKEVTPEPIYKYMKLCWGFSHDIADTRGIICVQRYFPVETEVIERPAFAPHEQRYAWPRDKAFATPKLAWEHLQAKRVHDLEYATLSLQEINSDLCACERALNPDGKPPENVVPFKGEEK